MGCTDRNSKTFRCALGHRTHLLGTHSVIRPSSPLKVWPTSADQFLSMKIWHLGIFAWFWVFGGWWCFVGVFFSRPREFKLGWYYFKIHHYFQLCNLWTCDSASILAYAYVTFLINIECLGVVYLQSSGAWWQTRLTAEPLLSKNILHNYKPFPNPNTCFSSFNSYLHAKHHHVEIQKYSSKQPPLHWSCGSSSQSQRSPCRNKEILCVMKGAQLQDQGKATAESLRVAQSGFSHSVKTPLEHKTMCTPLRAAAAFQDPKDSQQFPDLGSGPDALYISSQTAFGRKSFPLLQYWLQHPCPHQLTSWCSFIPRCITPLTASEGDWNFKGTGLVMPPNTCWSSSPEVITASVGAKL